jgi:hypothetical protein
VTDESDDDFEPSTGAVSALRWCAEMGATTLGEAYEFLDQFEISNDVPEVLGHDDTVEGIKAEFELGIDLVGPDAWLTDLL